MASPIPIRLRYLSGVPCGVSGHRVSHRCQIRINPNTCSAIGVFHSIARSHSVGPGGRGRCQGLRGARGITRMSWSTSTGGEIALMTLTGTETLGERTSDIVENTRQFFGTDLVRRIALHRRLSCDGVETGIGLALPFLLAALATLASRPLGAGILACSVCAAAPGHPRNHQNWHRQRKTGRGGRLRLGLHGIPGRRRSICCRV